MDPVYLKRDLEHNKVNSNFLNISNSFLLLFLNMWVVCFQVRVYAGTCEDIDGHACVSVLVGEGVTANTENLLDCSFALLFEAGFLN